MNIRKILPAIGIIILVYILITLDTKEVVAVFSKINPLYSALSFLALVPILLMTNYQWQLILKKHKINVSPFYSLKNILIGYFYGFITPGGIGAYTRTLYLHDESGAPIEKCVSNIIILNTIDYISLLTLGIIGAVLISTRFPYLLFLMIILLIIVISLFLFFLRKETWTGFLKKILQSRIFNPFKDKLNKSLESFYEDMPTPKDLILPFTISIIGWIVRFSELYIISKLFAIEVPYIFFILMIAIGNIVGSIPITIYGLGTREITLISLFSIFSISQATIIGLSLFWFVIVWLFPSVLGAIVAVKESRRINQLKSKIMV